MSFKRSDDWTMEELEALPQSRGEASRLGKKYYFSGTLCKYNHISARTLDSKCMRCRYLRNKRYKDAKPSKYGKKPSAKRTNAPYQNTLEHFILNSAKGRAKKRQIEFKLSIEDVVVPDICPILGIPIRKQWGGIKQTNLERSNQPSLDRIDSNKGYIKGNVVVISYRANILKGGYSSKEHRRVAQFWADFQNLNS